jgi:hypothetical protein
LEEELKKLYDLKQESILIKIADYEDEKKRIAEIFERINEARIQFEVCPKAKSLPPSLPSFQLAVNIRVFKSVYEIGKLLKVRGIVRFDDREVPNSPPNSNRF